MPPHEIPHDEVPYDSAWPNPADPEARRALRVGIGGPVGSGKTTLVGAPA
jgi:urease accessory protein